MANITIQFPDAAMPRIVEAYTKQHGYLDTVVDPSDPSKSIPNPETKNQFVQRIIKTQIRDTVSMFEGMVANQAAAEKARGDLG